MSDADELSAEAEYCRRLARETDHLTRRILIQVAEQYVRSRGALAFGLPERSSAFAGMDSLTTFAFSIFMCTASAVALSASPLAVA